MEAERRLGQWPAFHESVGIMPTDSTAHQSFMSGSTASSRLDNRINEWR
jgi:hypothetical protein